MKSSKTRMTIIFFLLPCLLSFLLVIGVPFIRGVYLSFTNWDRPGQANLEFVGLVNYTKFFSEPQFLYSMIWTFIYTIANVMIVNAAAILLAIAVTKNLRFKNLYRAGFFIPNLIGGIVLGTVWAFIYNNAIVSIANSLDIAFLQKSLLDTPFTAKLALITVGSWQYIGYIMIIYIAAIQNIPKDLIEASSIDGANTWQRFKNVVLPMIAQAFTISTFLTLVNSFKQYDINLMLGNGGPSFMQGGQILESTQLLALDIVKRGMLGSNVNKLALGQAEAIIFFIILFSISIVQVAINKRREVEM